MVFYRLSSFSKKDNLGLIAEYWFMRLEGRFIFVDEFFFGAKVAGENIH